MRLRRNGILIALFSDLYNFFYNALQHYTPGLIWTYVPERKRFKLKLFHVLMSETCDTYGRSHR